MILDSEGALSRFVLQGHVAGASKGENLACAAVSLIARSVAALLASRPGWIVNGDAPHPGNLSLEIRERPEETTEWLKGVSDTFLRALSDIDREYPLALSLSIEEESNGS